MRNDPSWSRSWQTLRSRSAGIASATVLFPAVACEVSPCVLSDRCRLGIGWMNTELLSAAGMSIQAAAERVLRFEGMLRPMDAFEAREQEKS